MSDTPKIIQLLMCPNDNVWQGVLLGLGDDGVTYHCQGGTWQPCIPKLAHKEIELAEADTVSATLLTTKCRKLAEVTKQLHHAVGLLSTTPQFENQHPEDILIALKGGQP